MTDPPKIRILRGNATPEEEAAINAAILKIWRDDITAAAAEGSEDPWITAARRDGLRRSSHPVAGRDAWRLSARR